MTDAKPKKVTVVSRLYAPEVGAAAFRLKALVDGLMDAGAKVSVVTTKAPKDSKPFRPSYAISRWPVLRDAGGNVRGYIQYLSFDIPMFFRVLFGARPDVFVVEPPPTSGLAVMVAARLRRVPFVYFSADVSSSAARGIGVNNAVVAAVTILERSILTSAATVLAVSAGVETEIAELTRDQAHVVNVGTGVDTTAFSPVGLVKEIGKRFFVYAGTMSEIQGAGVFVDAFMTIADDYPDVQLVMFGQGVELAELKARSADCGSQVQFFAPKEGTEIAQWHRGAVANLASVRPGKGYDFAFATKALAGLSAGAPVIYSGVGPMHDLVTEHDLGIACAWDPDAVAAAMRTMLENSVDSKRRRELSQWVSENYSLEAVGATGAEAVLNAALGR
ncbi:glycosyltransferase [Arthrobacter sp. N199823]|uniref:glycosyltransferase n=1 Tax=Arthrobacter sp. N199823 TaxID=2058895 RepID=UPI000CE3884E|nr:glycosyltransferase [Arthrobacter sp. N199823]